MKRMLTMIVPLAMLVGFASIGLAADDATDLNRELNDDIRSDVAGGATPAGESDVVIDDDSYEGTVDPNNTDARESRSLVAKRGRQPRRGQTASDQSEVQLYWGRHKHNDEGPDEDEDDDITPYGN